MLFIGHFAHWNREEILNFTEEEVYREYEACVELYNELNTVTDET